MTCPFEYKLPLHFWRESTFFPWVLFKVQFRMLFTVVDLVSNFVFFFQTWKEKYILFQKVNSCFLTGLEHLHSDQ